MRRVDLRGKKFGSLLVVEEAGKINGSKSLSWLCLCDCGTKKTILASNLTGGRSLTCGCGQRRASSNTSKTHGFSKTRLYRVYKGIIQRCSNPANPAFRHYGGRGIKMCDQWRESFVAFREWALTSGYREDSPLGTLSLDRIDPNGNYEPSNCRWETIQIQQNNKRNSAFIVIGEEKLTIAQWAKTKGTSSQTLYSKMYRLFEQLGLSADEVAGVEIKLK